jgi:3-oxoacyl-[acyl-carrier-protein] synthase III
MTPFRGQSENAEHFFVWPACKITADSRLRYNSIREWTAGRSENNSSDIGQLCAAKSRSNRSQSKRVTADFYFQSHGSRKWTILHNSFQLTGLTSHMKPRLAYRRFVALTEEDVPHLLARMSGSELDIEAERYGIKSRLIARPAATIIDLAAAAIDKVCVVNAVPRRELGGAVLSSRHIEIDHLAKQLATHLGNGLQVHGIERACSGFPAATRLAMNMALETGKPIAVVTSEIISRNINWESPDGTPDDQQRARGQASKLFADGAAAVLVEPRASAGSHEILDCWVDEVPDKHQLLQKADVANACDPWGQPQVGVVGCISMPGRRGYLLLKRAPELMIMALEKSLDNSKRIGSLGDEILSDVVHHQANGMMVPIIEQQLAATSWGNRARVWNCITHHGNTVSATIPLAMAEVQDRLSPGALVGMPSVGAGGPGYRPDVLSTGCVLVRRVGVANSPT